MPEIFMFCRNAPFLKSGQTHHYDSVIIFNPQHMHCMQGYGTRLVCLSVYLSVTVPAATYLVCTSMKSEAS